MPTLVVTAEGAGTKAIPVKSVPFVIGKDPKHHLVLEAPNISRNHCQIRQEGGRFLVEDLGSRNGTFVDGQRINTPALLKDGTRMDLGPFILTFRLDARDGGKPGAPAPGAPAGDAGTQREQMRADYEDFKRQLHKDLLARRDIQKLDVLTESEEEIRNKTSHAIREILDGKGAALPRFVEKETLLKEMMALSLGLGPLEDLLADPAVTEIMVNRWDRIFVERKGKITLSEQRFMDDKQVVNVIRRIIAPIGRRIDENTPMVNARLPDGSRVNAVIMPLAISGPAISIRKFSKTPFQVGDLVRFGSMTPEMSEFIKTCVEAKKNVIISGGTGSGKTTLLNLMATFIPGDERIVTIEDSAELKLQQMNLVSLESKPPNIEGKGAIPIRDLVMNSLRMRPDRIVVGECRGGEAFDMIQAMNTGHDGSMTTIHASNPREAVRRLESLVMMAGFDLPARAIREQVATAVKLFVQTLRYSDGTRKISHISEVQGIQKDEVFVQDIFIFDQTGIDEHGKIVGAHRATGNIPKFYPELVDQGFKINMDIFF